MFYPIPEEFDGIRHLPKQGGWVILIKPLRFGREFSQIAPLNIYWAYGEDSVWNLERVMAEFLSLDWDFKRQPYKSPKTTAKAGRREFFDEDKKKKLINFLDDFASARAIRYAENNNGDSTIAKLHTQYQDTMKVFDREYTVLSKAHLDEYIACGEFEPVSFVNQNGIMPPFGQDMEEIRDLVGALMLDGFTKEQAVNELVTCGELPEKYVQLPTWYYRASKGLRATFFDLEEEPPVPEEPEEELMIEKPKRKRARANGKVPA